MPKFEIKWWPGSANCNKDPKHATCDHPEKITIVEAKNRKEATALSVAIGRNSDGTLITEMTG